MAGAYRMFFILMSAIFTISMHFVSQIVWDYVLLPLLFNSTLEPHFQFLKFICWFSLYFIFSFLFVDY